MPNEPSETAEVLLATESQEYHFKPHLVWVKPGGTVTWRLESGSHDVVAYHPDNDRPRRIPEEAEPWNSKLLSEEGTTFEYTFETEGVYDYYCTPHESLGMVGTVIVGDPDPHDQPALEEPQSSLPEGARAELEDLAASVDEILGHTH
ncbi:MAG: plastocyanin/azurin family copper-binding protein [Halobacteriales archaeon]